MKQQHSILERIAPFLVSVAVILGDRWSKLAIQHRMGPFDVIGVIPGWLRIIHTENPGAAFGMLADGSAIVRSAVLIGVSALVLLFVVSALWRRSESFASALTRVALALILGGAAGNLYDRVLRGTVTDFIEVYHGTWSFPAFNVADSAITVGAVFLLVDLLRPHRKQSSIATREACYRD